MAVLEERDLNFVVETVSPGAKNKETMKMAILEDRDFRANIIGNDLVFDRVFGNHQLILGISPTFLFEVLLRRSVKEMRKSVYTVERSAFQKIPVFDTIDALNFINEEGVFDYFINFLVSFIGSQKQITAGMDVESLVKLGLEADNKQRFEIYKRTADICLLILGVFPEYVMYDYDYLFLNKKIPITGPLAKTVGEYEMLGKECYELAAKQEKARIEKLDRILGSFSRRFYLAKKPLNYMSKHLIKLVK